MTALTLNLTYSSNEMQRNQRINYLAKIENIVKIKQNGNNLLTAATYSSNKLRRNYKFLKYSDC